MRCKFERSVLGPINHIFIVITELQESKLDVVFAEWCNFSEDEKRILCEVAKRVPDVADLFICGIMKPYKIIAAGVNAPNTVKILLEKE